MKMISFVLVASVMLGGNMSFAATSAETPPASEKHMLSSAIFVMNRAGKDYDEKLDVLNDMIATRLTEKGFTIIDKNEALGKFREYREIKREDDAKGGNVSALLGKLGLDKKDDGPKSLDELIEPYSAKKIANMLHADYLIIATINSVGKETRKGQAFGENMGAVTTTMRVALKVLEGNMGGSVAGTIVESKDRIPLMDGLEIENTDLSNQLLDNCAVKIAEEIGTKTERIRNVEVKAAAMVEISIAGNIEGAEVSLDGVMYGTTPCKIMVPQGPASLKVSREWFKPVEKFINPFQGQAMTVTLELSEEGVKRWKDEESFKLAMAKEKQDQVLEKKEREAQVDINKEQSAADAYSKKQIAEGEKKKREQSYVHDDGIGNEIKRIIHGN